MEQKKHHLSFKKPSTRNGVPSHTVFSGRVTQTLIKEHGSYAAAKAHLENANAQSA